MPKLKSLEDLKRVREEATQSLKVRLDTGTTIIVGMGTCGIAAGARETMRAILEELAKRQIDAHVTTVGCIGMCVKEPLVDIVRRARTIERAKILDQEGIQKLALTDDWAERDVKEEIKKHGQCGFCFRAYREGIKF